MEGFNRMNSAQVIANYELLSALTRQMLEAAKSEEWDNLISIEQQCRELIAATIKPLDAEVMLDGAACQHKKHLINNILTDDAEIRLRVQEWMRQLQLSMQSNRQEQRLLHAYGA
jgi:flagellar protein FliT